jgi:hypothetical protein
VDDWQLRCQPSIGITRKIRKVLCPKPGADGEPRSGKTRSLCGETLDPEPLSAAKQFASRVQLIEIGTLSANLTRMVFLAIRMHCG